MFTIARGLFAESGRLSTHAGFNNVPAFGGLIGVPHSATTKCRHTGRQRKSTRTHEHFNAQSCWPSLGALVGFSVKKHGSVQATSITPRRCTGQVEQLAANQRLLSNEDRVL